MRHEYAGDVGDYVKYALLRVLCAAGRTTRLGVIWYVTDHPVAEKVGAQASVAVGATSTRSSSH